MKKILVVMIVMLTAGCSGMGMRSSGSSSGTGGAGSSGSSMDIYRPNFNPGPYDESMDPLFKPYFGG